jgi:hypothetical protein
VLSNEEEIHFDWQWMDDPKWQSSLPEIKLDGLRECLSNKSKVLIPAAAVHISSNVAKNLSWLVRQEGQKIRNETEVRFCIGGPISCGICNAWGYKTKLEESVKDQINESGQVFRSDNPEPGSYGSDNVTSVIFEANHTSNTKLHHILF